MRLERVSWIDICRGIGIIAVLYGHALSGDSIRYLIYAFHMPLFFFISGMVFRYKENQSFFFFFKKAVKDILYPYFLFAFLTFLVSLINQNLSPFPFDKVFRDIYGTFYASGNDGHLAYNVVLWFLPCLFVTKILFYFITRFLKKKYFIVLSLLFFSIVGYLFSLFLPQVKLPFGIETALNSVVFYGMGFMSNSYIPQFGLLSSKKIKLFLIFIAFSLISIVVASVNYNIYGRQIDLRLNFLSNYYFFYIAAFSGIFSIVILSIIIKKNFLLEYIGKNSLILFVWHLVAFSYFTKFLVLFITPRTIDNLRNVYMAPVYTLVSIAIILLSALTFKALRRLLLSLSRAFVQK